MPSQFGEDKWIEKNLKLPERGFYLDVGCAGPVDCSNTEFLRKRGWEGMAIDANANYFDLWRDHLHFVCALVSVHPLVPFDYKAMSTHSRVGGVVVHGTTTLDRLMQGAERDRVDFLSLDVEGHEYEALRSLDIDKYRPEVVVSEFLTDGIEGEDWRVRDYLITCGYELVHQTLVNIIMVRK